MVLSSTGGTTYRSEVMYFVFGLLVGMLFGIWMMRDNVETCYRNKLPLVIGGVVYRIIREVQ